jgi:hypothetical protein
LSPYQDNILDLWNAAVADAGYGQTFTCDASLAVGDPVRISAANTVAKSTADTIGNSIVAGFCSYKPTTTTCLIDHFYKATGTSFTAGNYVYLSDTGTYSASAGTVTVILGRAINSTTALLFSSTVEGVSGASGSSGASGFSSTSGWSGISGPSGISGHSGTEGGSGTSGWSGSSGLAGRIRVIAEHLERLVLRVQQEPFRVLLRTVQ